MIKAAVICFAGGVVLAYLLREEISDAAIALGLCAAAGLFSLWGAYLMGAEVRVARTSIAWSRGRREVCIPWSQVTEVRHTSGDQLVIRSPDSKIGVDKQLDDYQSFSELVRKYAPPFAWKTLSLPLRCRARLLLPGILCISGLAWVAFMWWACDYSPPTTSTDLAIVIVMTGLGALPIPVGVYLATFRCEFDLHRIRAGALLRKKTYEVANLVDMRLTTVQTTAAVQRHPATIVPTLTAQQIEFRFKDGAELKLPPYKISLDPEALYQLLRQYYGGAVQRSSSEP